MRVGEIEVRPATKTEVSDRTAALNFLLPLADTLGISIDLIRGVIDYVFKKKLCKKPSDFDFVIGALERLRHTFGNFEPYKAKTFNYLTDSNDLETVLSQATKNAQYFVDLMGVEFFKPHELNKQYRRDSYMSAQIPGTDFYLYLEGGRGAGTFSLNFVLGYYDPRASGAAGLWDATLDTDGNQKLGCRIIETKGRKGLKIPKSHEQLTYRTFCKQVGIKPERALAFLLTCIAYNLGAHTISVLSTEGAKKLSTLGNSPQAFNYSEFFKSVGFQDATSNPNWLEIPNLQHQFYASTTCDDPASPGLRRYELDGFEKVLAAFAQLKDPKSGRYHSISLFRSESREEIAKAMIAAGVCNGKFGWKKEDLLELDMATFYHEKAQDTAANTAALL